MRTAAILVSVGVILAVADGRAAIDGTEPVRLAVAGRANTTPSIAARDAFVAVAWSATASGSSDVVLAVSRDGGITFGPPVQVNDQRGEARNGGEMPPQVALAPSSDGSGPPAIVVVWRARTPVTSIRYARSRDGGRSFSPAVSLQAPEAVGERGWQEATVGPDGRVHAVWLDHRGLAPTAGGGGAAHAHHAASAVDGVAMAQRSGLYYTRVDTGSSAPVAERELAKGVCYCCKTALAAGPDGALYAAWRHVYAGNIRDIAFASSRDAGRTFAEPGRVSEDQWQLAGCPDDGPSMTVDRQGVAQIVWPTVIAGDTPQGALFIASTRDGRTFTPRVRVEPTAGPKPSHPQVAAGAEGRLALAWDESGDGVRRAVLVFASPATRGIDFSPRLLLEPSSETPRPSVYPALASAGSHVLVAWTSGSGDASDIAVRRVAFPAVPASR